MTEVIRYWETPDLKLLNQGLSRLTAMRRKHLFITVNVPLLLRSRRKENAILDTQIIATNMTATILEHLREDPDAACFGKAITFIVKTFARHKALTSDLLANTLSHGFEDLPGCKDRVTPQDFPIASTLRLGVFRNCAKLWLAWYRSIQRLLGSRIASKYSDKDQRKKELSILNAIFDHPADWRLLHHCWAEAVITYQQAADTRIPFGRHAGKRLADVGKREVRWLREKLLSPDQITEQLAALKMSRRPDERDRHKQALRTMHLWRTSTKSHYALRAAHLDQRSVPHSYPAKVKLRLLKPFEHDQLYSELVEHQEFAQEFAKIREQVDLFLDHRLPGYPTVHHIPRTLEEIEELERQYQAALERLDSPYPKNSRRGKPYTPQELEQFEREAREAFQKIAAKFRQKFQPLTYTRTIGEEPYVAAFALLFSPRNRTSHTKMHTLLRSSDELAFSMPEYEYTLAICLHGEYATDHFSPERVGRDLRFINFPETPFIKPPRKSVMFSPIQCGLRQEINHFLPLIEMQRRKQHELHYSNVVQGKNLLLPESKPETALVSAQITSFIGRRGHIRFVAHLCIQKPVPPLRYLPEAVIGFHPYAEGYRYAVLRFDKTVVYGDLNIPTKVLPKTSQAAYSSNYVYTVAHAMIEVATRYRAYIGVEDVRWQRQASLSAGLNRQAFRQPHLKIFQKLWYKSQLAGLLRPRHIRSVGYKDCARCALPDNPSTHGTGKNREGIFTCDRCGGKKNSQDNRALLVACRTIEYLANIRLEENEDSSSMEH